MLPEIGGLEYLVIAAVALIVVGPKDLPVMLRKLGQFVGRLRSMANEFRASFDEMARQSELDELRKEVEAMRRGQSASMDASNAEVEQVFNEIGNSLSGSGVTFSPAQAAPSSPEPEPVVEAPKPRARKAPAKAAAKTAAKPKPKAAPAKTTAKKAAPRKAAAKAGAKA